MKKEVGAGLAKSGGGGELGRLPDSEPSPVNKDVGAGLGHFAERNSQLGPER